MNAKADGIVLFHGILRTGRNMARLARFLEHNGYKILNVTYPSSKKTIEEIVEHVQPGVSEFAESLDGCIHFVGFSMGGLIIRAYLHRHRPSNLGRVVMMGTPNHGSEVADALRDWKLYRKVFGPAGQQLVTTLDGSEELFGKVDYELGVIAGNRTIDPISSYLIGKPNDGKVSIESTKLQGMKDHTVVAVAHTLFPQSKKAWQHVLSFLSNGRFESAS